MEEYLDIVDVTGQPTGQTVVRSIAHEKGILHRTGHVWIFRVKHDQIEVLLQKRSRHKSSYPGLYDISTAGHIPAGSGRIESAIREAKEELGIDIREEDLIDGGMRFLELHEVFDGKPFFDRQISDVYACAYDGDNFEFSDHEVEAVQWMPASLAIEKVYNHQIASCIVWQELLLAYLSFQAGKRILPEQKTVNDFMDLIGDTLDEKSVKILLKTWKKPAETV